MTTSLLWLSGLQLTLMATYQISRLSTVQSVRLANVGLGLGPIFFLIVAIVLPRWTMRCRDNAELIAPGGQRSSRAGAGWCWFVPVANVWWPGRIVLDIWRAGVPTEGMWKVELWWFTRLGATVVATVGLSSHLDLLILLGRALHLVSMAVFVPLVRQIAAAQAAAIELLGNPAVGEPELQPS